MAQWQNTQIQRDNGMMAEAQAPSIDKLIEDFIGDDPYPAIDARHKLQERFGAQSHQEQIKIIKTFLESVDGVDHEWCCDTMQIWWDDCLIPDVKKAWETYGESCCAGVVAKRLPLDYVMKHQEALENDNYAAVCWRLATTEDYDIYENELTRKEFLDIAVHNHWSISDDDADELLFGFVLDILNDKALVDGCGYGHGVVHDGDKFYTEPKKFLEPSSYTKPSLLNILDMPFYVDAIEKLGKVNTLRKLYEWNELIKRMQTVSFTVHDEELLIAQHEGFETYIKLIWNRFMDTASYTFPFLGEPDGKAAFRKTHNKYSFAKQEQKEYYPGYTWEEENPF